MVAPVGRQSWRGPLRSPIHSNVSPYRQDDVSNLSVDRQIRSPNKSQPKFRPVGASGRNYTETHRGVKPEWRRFEGRSSRPCWQSETSVSCHQTILLIQGNSSRLAETGRDRGPHHARRTPERPGRTRASYSFHGRVTQTRESVYQRTVVLARDAWSFWWPRSLGHRSRLEGIEAQSSKSAHLATSPLSASEIAATLTGVYQIAVRNLRSPNKS